MAPLISKLTDEEQMLEPRVHHAGKLEYPVVVAMKVDWQNLCLCLSGDSSNAPAPGLFSGSHAPPAETRDTPGGKNAEDPAAREPLARSAQALRIEVAPSATSLRIDKNPAFTEFWNCGEHIHREEGDIRPSGQKQCIKHQAFNKTEGVVRHYNQRPSRGYRFGTSSGNRDFYLQCIEQRLREIEWSAFRQRSVDGIKFWETDESIEGPPGRFDQRARHPFCRELESENMPIARHSRQDLTIDPQQSDTRSPDYASLVTSTSFEPGSGPLVGKLDELGYSAAKPSAGERRLF